MYTIEINIILSGNIRISENRGYLFFLSGTVDELNEAKRQAEKKAEDEFKIRTNLEQSKKEVDEEKKGIV